jgi:hypothetical protein
MILEWYRREIEKRREKKKKIVRGKKETTEW